MAGAALTCGLRPDLQRLEFATDDVRVGRLHPDFLQGSVLRCHTETLFYLPFPVQYTSGSINYLTKRLLLKMYYSCSRKTHLETLNIYIII